MGLGAAAYGRPCSAGALSLCTNRTWVSVTSRWAGLGSAYPCAHARHSLRILHGERSRFDAGLEHVFVSFADCLGNNPNEKASAHITSQQTSGLACQTGMWCDRRDADSRNNCASTWPESARGQAPLARQASPGAGTGTATRCRILTLGARRDTPFPPDRHACGQDGRISASRRPPVKGHDWEGRRGGFPPESASETAAEW